MWQVVNDAYVRLGPDDLGQWRAVRTGVMTMAMSADAVFRPRSTVVAFGRIVIDHLMRGRRFGRTSCGVNGRRKNKRSDNQRQRRQKPHQSRHRPGHQGRD